MESHNSYNNERNKQRALRRYVQFGDHRDPLAASELAPVPENPNEHSLWLSVLKRAKNDLLMFDLESDAIAQKEYIQYQAYLWFTSRRALVGSWIWIRNSLRLAPGQIDQIRRLVTAYEQRADTPKAA